MLRGLYAVFAGAPLLYGVLVIFVGVALALFATYFAGPAIGGAVGLVIIFLVLSPIFPIPLKSKVVITLLCAVLGIGMFRIFLGAETTSSLRGYLDAAKRNMAVGMNLEEEQYELYTLKKGTPLYLLKNGNVEFEGKMKTDIAVRLIPGIVELNDVKYRGVKFPMVRINKKTGRDEFVEHVFDATSEHRLVTVSFLGQSEREEISAVEAGKAVARTTGHGFLFSPLFWVITVVLALLILVNLFSGKTTTTATTGRTFLKTVSWTVAVALGLFVAYGVIAALAHSLCGADLNNIVASAIAADSKPAVEEPAPEVKIQLVPGRYDPGQQFKKIILPVAYRKIILTETIRVRAVTKPSALVPVTAHFGWDEKGKASLKAPMAVSYYLQVIGSYRSNTFMILLKGTIIDFGSVDEAVVWFTASGGHRLVLEQDRADKPIMFAYREYKQ